MGDEFDRTPLIDGTADPLPVHDGEGITGLRHSPVAARSHEPARGFLVARCDWSM